MNKGLIAAHRRIQELTEAKRGLVNGEYDLSEILNHWSLGNQWLTAVLAWQPGWGRIRAIKFIERYKIDDMPIGQLDPEVKRFIRRKIHEPLPPKKNKGPYAPTPRARSDTARAPKQVKGTDQGFRHGQGLGY